MNTKFFTLLFLLPLTTFAQGSMQAASLEAKSDQLKSTLLSCISANFTTVSNLNDLLQNDGYMRAKLNEEYVCNQEKIEEQGLGLPSELYAKLTRDSKRDNPKTLFGKQQKIEKQMREVEDFTNHFNDYALSPFAPFVLGALDVEHPENVIWNQKTLIADDLHLEKLQNDFLKDMTHLLSLKSSLSKKFSFLSSFNSCSSEFTNYRDSLRLIPQR